MQSRRARDRRGVERSRAELQRRAAAAGGRCGAALSSGPAPRRERRGGTLWGAGRGRGSAEGPGQRPRPERPRPPPAPEVTRQSRPPALSAAAAANKRDFSPRPAPRAPLRPSDWSPPPPPAGPRPLPASLAADWSAGGPGGGADWRPGRPSAGSGQGRGCTGAGRCGAERRRQRRRGPGWAGQGRSVLRTGRLRGAAEARSVFSGPVLFRPEGSRQVRAGEASLRAAERGWGGGRHRRAGLRSGARRGLRGSGPGGRCCAAAGSGGPGPLRAGGVGTAPSARSAGLRRGCVRVPVGSRGRRRDAAPPRGAENGSVRAGRMGGGAVPAVRLCRRCAVGSARLGSAEETPRPPGAARRGSLPLFVIRVYAVSRLPLPEDGGLSPTEG